MTKCLFCYKELPDEFMDFHLACSGKIFGTTKVPELNYVRDDLRDLAKEVISRSVTIPGIQPKISLDIHKGPKHHPCRFTIVGLWGKYILKPQTDLYPHLPELEDLTMHLAEVAKIHTVPHSLIRFKDGELCYITRRIDRTDVGKKIPMEDMCQLTERLTEHKYKGSHEQIAKAIEKYSSAPMIDLVNYWELVIFSWLTGNADMHLKNFSLYQPRKGLTMLAPGYDLINTKIVIPDDKEELALTLNGKKRKLVKSDFEKAMIASGINQKSIDNIFKKFTKALPLWTQTIDDSFLPLEMKNSYKEMLEFNVSRIGLKMEIE